MKPLPENLRSLLRQRVHNIDTPALVVDLDAMDRNLQRMADFARKHQIRWRPHAKMHKSTELALMMVEAGASGVCVQKTSEAEAMANGGVRNIFITNEVVSQAKLSRVAQLAASLAERGGLLSITVDNAEGIRRLAEAMAGHSTGIQVFVEIDVGQGRCGVAPGEPAVALLQEMKKHPALRFGGLQAYHGKAQHFRTVQERSDAIAQAVRDVRLTIERLQAAGFDVPLVTGAGTGTFAHEAASGAYGELQPGSFLFMDADYAQNERDPAQPPFEHALFVKTQVISVSPGHVVCDAGHKSHAIDSGLPRVHALEPGRDLEYFNGGDEHGILRTANGNDRLPLLGRFLWLIPGHCDPTVNLHDFIIGVRGGLTQGTVDRIIRVDARGALT
ncbi:MAG TPA: DSD1 family PLP-dependent enzyme [Burkholderiaceae bacterium]|nr:DSD1 family PLP-dependent enzyme [Burkholderiaceae bacterium]